MTASYKEVPSKRDRSLRIVIVDDERDTVDTLCAVLADEGHDVVGATSGAEAIRQVRAQLPDAVLVDINMPGISGYEVGRELRRLYGEYAPVMVAISGRYTGQTDKMLSKLAGFHHFLEKPCDPRVVIILLAPLRRREKPKISFAEDTVIPRDPDAGPSVHD